MGPGWRRGRFDEDMRCLAWPMACGVTAHLRAGRGGGGGSLDKWCRVSRG
jgi:hypothetical protein